MRLGVHVIGVRKDKGHSWKRKGLYFGNIDQETAILNPPNLCSFLCPVYEELRERSQVVGCG